MPRTPRRRQLGGGSAADTPDSSSSIVFSPNAEQASAENLVYSLYGNGNNHADDNKEHKKRQQTRLLRRSERVVSFMLVVLFFVLVAVLMFVARRAPTPGLLTAHPITFQAAPTAELRRTVCIDTSEVAVAQAFQQRGWTVIPLEDSKAYKQCHEEAKAAVIWTKLKPKLWGKAQPWQRHNWLPFQNAMSRKSTFQLLLNNYTAETGNQVEFVPTSFVLPNDRERLLVRLADVGETSTSSSSSLRLGGNQHDNHQPVVGGGMNEPWVVKLSATDNGIGIAIVGPHSDRLQLLRDTLQRTTNASDYMTILREAIVLKRQEHDSREPSEVQKARWRSITQNDQIIVQRYVCHELDYQTHKFDLRIYFLVASTDPLVVYYHDGSLRVALAAYNDQSFGDTSQHLTNIGRNLAIDNCTASFADWQKALHEYVTSPAGAHLPDVVKRDPLGHVRNQIKAALADLVAAARHKAFAGYRGTYTTMQNGFALMGGDFIVDRDLHVWMTECQSSPGLGHATSTRQALYAALLPSAADIVAEVMDKQAAGLPLFPMQHTGQYQLIYTDDFHYKYDFVHKEQRGPC